MNRRNFIKLTSVAAGAVATQGMYAFAPCKKHFKTKVFVLRGVNLVDLEFAIKEAEKSLSKILTYKTQIAKIENFNFTHLSGFNELMNGKFSENEIARTEKLENYKIDEVVKNSLKNIIKQPIVYFHHTEIAHSSKKIYQQHLIQLITEIIVNFDGSKQSLVITTDIGRNSKANAMGGMDHSTKECANTFAVYLGNGFEKLSVKNEPVTHKELIIDLK